MAAEAGALRAVVPVRQLPGAAGARSGRLAAVWLVGPPLGGALFGLARRSRSWSTSSPTPSRACPCWPCGRPSSRSASPTARRCARASLRAPLPLGPPVPADLRVPVRAGELHRPRGPARGRGPRRPAGAVGRPGRAAGGHLRGLPAARLVPVAAGPQAPPGPRGAGAGAVDLDRLRPVPGLAERVRADRRHPADRPGHPLDRLGGPRLPDRDDARPAGRTGRVHLEHDFAADRAARPAGRRDAARQRPARAAVAVFAAFGLVLAVWGTLSPSIREAPSLEELDELPA